MHNFLSVSTKFWDSSIDLVNVLKLEIRDGQLSFRGKRILEVIHVIFLKFKIIMLAFSLWVENYRIQVLCFRFAFILLTT